MRLTRHLASACATLLVTVVIYIVLTRWLFAITPYNKFSDKPLDPGPTTILATNTAIAREIASTIVGSESALFDLNYPTNMRINETVSIKLVHDRGLVLIRSVIDSDAGERQEIQTSYPGRKGIRLRSPAFEISPDERLEKDSTTTLPTSFTWLVKPKTEGSHKLTLDISELLFHDSRRSLIVNRLMVNGKEQSAKDIDSLEIPVSVYTIWGISERTYQGIIWLVVLAGAGVSYPFSLQP